MDPFLFRQVLNDRGHVRFSRSIYHPIGACLAFFRCFGRNQLHFNEDAICLVRRCGVHGCQPLVGVGLVHLRIRCNHSRRVTQRWVQNGLSTTRIYVGRPNHRANRRHFHCSQRAFCRRVAIYRGDHRRRIRHLFLASCSKNGPFFRSLCLLKGRDWVCPLFDILFRGFLLCV